MDELTISEEIRVEWIFFIEIFGKSITNNKGEMFWSIHTSLKTFDFKITNFPNEPTNLLLQQKLTGSVFCSKQRRVTYPNFSFLFYLQLRPNPSQYNSEKRLGIKEKKEIKVS